MTPWITIAGWTLVHFLWQGAVIGATAAVGLALLFAERRLLKRVTAWRRRRSR